MGHRYKGQNRAPRTLAHERDRRGCPAAQSSSGTMSAPLPTFSGEKDKHKKQIPGVLFFLSNSYQTKRSALIESKQRSKTIAHYNSKYHINEVKR